MAINKTYFTGSTSGANYTEVLAWLQANASDYFDEITGDGTYISCNIATVTALKLDFTSSGYLFTITTNNGKYVQEYKGWSDSRFAAAQKTDSGIFLFLSEVSNIFITKTDSGSVFFAGISRTDSSNCAVYMCDFSNSSKITQGLSTDASNFGANPVYFGVYPESKTAIVQVVSDGGTHCENLFLVPFTQYAGQSDVVIDIDGTKYVYNGIFALKE